VRHALAAGHAGAGRHARLFAQGGAAPRVLQPVLARARHRVGRCLHRGLSGSIHMKTDVQESRHDEQPGGPADLRTNLLKYTGGLVFSIILTGVSFWVSATGFVWPGGVPVLLAALAIAQMGVHLLMFLHGSSRPDSTNN